MMKKYKSKFKEVDPEVAKLYHEITKVENDILSTLTSLKKIKNKSLQNCDHLILEPECSQYDSMVDYYDLFWKTFLLNEIKRERIIMADAEIKEISESVSYIERKYEKYEKLVSYRKKQGREEKYKCHLCHKEYQSQCGLKWHLKAKHRIQRNDQNYNVEGIMN